MIGEPRVEYRDEQPYAGLPATVTMATLAQAIDQGYPRLFRWLDEHAIAPAGPPFIRYLVIDMAADLDIELGVPVAATVAADDQVQAGMLPGGRYATLLYAGPYDGLIGANAALQQWAQRQGLEFDAADTDRGSAWRCRVEHYRTDPSAEPDPAKWETDVAYLLRAGV